MRQCITEQGFILLFRQACNHFRQPLQAELLPVIPADITAQVSAGGRVVLGRPLPQRLQRQCMKVSHTVSIRFVAAGRIAVLLIRILGNPQPVLQEGITRTWLQNVLLIQRQLNKPDIVLPRLIGIPAENAQPGMFQIGYRIGFLHLFKGFEIRQRHFFDASPKIKYAHLRATFGYQFSNGHNFAPQQWADGDQPTENSTAGSLPVFARQPGISALIPIN